MSFDFNQSMFSIELSIAALLFAWGYDKRKHAILNGVAGECLMIFLASLVNPWITYGHAVYYFIIYILLFFTLWRTFQINWFEAVSISIIGYAAQHIGYDIFMLLLTVLRIDLRTILFSYFYYMMEILVYGGTYTVLYFGFAGRLHVNPDWLKKRKKWMLFFGGSIAFMVFLNLLKGDNLSFRQMLAFHIYDLTGTVVGLLLLFYMSWNSALKKDMEELQRILNLKKEYFEMMKENIELVNLRCHDISQHLDQFSENGMGLINESAIQQVKKDIRIYDSFVKTGNEPLDVVLTEKSLHCEKMGIRITCMADGEKLNFMNAIDIYFVFGNIIQNAIEAVEKLENIEQRIISLTVKKKEELLLIQSENYYNSPVIIRDDLPVTTKSDMTAHGLGMKSIRMILQKYDGEMSIHTENEIFLLNIVIPFPKGSDIL